MGSFQARKIQEHKRRQERKKEEKELKHKKERIIRAKEENERARKVSNGIINGNDQTQTYVCIKIHSNLSFI